jgi:hypothetical protein
MQPIEYYVEHADELAQDVVNFCGPTMQAGNPLTGELNALFDTADRYRKIKSMADNHREFGRLTEQEAAEEKALRQAFAEAYKPYSEKNRQASA